MNTHVRFSIYIHFFATLFYYLGDNCIQYFHLGRYIVRYTVRNLVLRRRASGAVKRDFRTYIRPYTSPNENVEYGYPHSNALLQFCLKFEHRKPHYATRHPTKYDVIDDVNMFPAVYRRIYCRKFLTLSNQTSHYKSKCIRMLVHCRCCHLRCVLGVWSFFSHVASVLSCVDPESFVRGGSTLTTFFF